MNSLNVTPQSIAELVCNFMESHCDNIFEILLNQPESDCIYQFPTDLDPNGHCPFGSKSVGNW